MWKYTSQNLKQDLSTLRETIKEIQQNSPALIFWLEAFFMVFLSFPVGLIFQKSAFVFFYDHYFVFQHGNQPGKVDHSHAFFYKDCLLALAIGVIAYVTITD